MTAGKSVTQIMRPYAFFVCATNRPCLGKNGQTLELLMYNQCCAAIWEYPKDTGKTVHHLTQMQRVQAGDLIFMFATGGVGIIAVGEAIGSCNGPFPVGDERRIRGDNWRAAEWQVPVKWLRWESANSCPFNGWNTTFYEVSGPKWSDRREPVIKHFRLGHV